MLKIVLYTNTVSPHQLPIARELAAMAGAENFKYVYVDAVDKDHGPLGWKIDMPVWCIHAECGCAGEWLENADLLLSGLRCFDLFERRGKKGLRSFYMTERWLKPPVGIARLLHPRYFGYARRFCELMSSGAVMGLPIGIHAARDMARLCGLMHGNLRCLFSAPDVDFERKACGRIFSRAEREGHIEKIYSFDKMRMWGYFVEKGRGTRNDGEKETQISVLWVGRLLKLKRVDTIIHAVGELYTGSMCSTQPEISLDIYGTGPEENRLKRIAAKYGEAVKFHSAVSIGEVRQLMQEHDVYVLSSNGYEGWGAVVNEALEEGMRVIGTYEAGASSTMLPDDCLFHSGDWKRLQNLLQGCAAMKRCGVLAGQSIDEWRAGMGTKRLLSLAELT